MSASPGLEKRGEYEYKVTGLSTYETVWIQIEGFDVGIKRTDEGIVVDVYDFDDEDQREPLSTCYAFDADRPSTQAQEVDDDA